MTDERSSDHELVLRAEALVAKRSPEEPNWEALATRVSERLANAPAVDDALLASPLPEEPGESALDRLIVKKPLAASPAAPAAEGVSLAELARATVARRGNRDATNIAKESLAVATQTRNLSERGADRRPPAEPAPAAERVAPARASVPPARLSVPPNSRRSGSLADSRGPWIGVAIAAIGLAAGFGLYVAGQRRAPEVVTIPAMNPALANAAEASKAEAPPPVAQAKPLDLTPAPVGQALDELPAAAETAQAAADKSAAAAVASAPARAAEAAKSGAPGRPFAGVTPERVVLAEEHAARPAAAGSARVLKPADSAPLRPAELNEQGSSGDRPTSGAAQAAVGAVLGAARACIAGQSAPSSATLVFGSSGQVERVSVTGPAAGTPAEGCVQAALKKARVQPFAADSFSLGVTVRPP